MDGRKDGQLLLSSNGCPSVRQYSRDEGDDEDVYGREREAELRRERARSSGRSGGRGRVILRDKARHLGGPGHGCNLRNTFNHWIGVRIHGCETRSARGSPFPPLSSDINRVCLSAVTREYRGLILKPE